MKKAILFIVCVAAVLGGAFWLSECSKVKTFDEDRVYVFESATLHFYDDYDKYLILGDKTEEEFIDSYYGLSALKFEFYQNGTAYEPKTNSVNYKMYYELKEGVVTLYQDKSKEEQVRKFTVDGNSITSNFYYFGSIGSGKSYFQITLRLE